MKIVHKGAAALAVGLFAGLHAPTAAAQGCLDWQPGFHLPGTNNEVRAIQAFDDGVGATPALYVGGTFTLVNGEPALKLARWQDGAWSEVGGGVGLAGLGHDVSALAVYDDGTGPKLYVGGTFLSVGSVSASGIAAWDGTQWSALGAGIAGSVATLEVFDDGSGSKLYVGGVFQSAGGVTVSNVAAWDGANWSATSTNLAGSGITDFEVHDDGAGPALYICGSGSVGGTSGATIGKLVGGTWVALPSTSNGPVSCLKSWNDGSGAKLYAGGRFTTLAGVNAPRIARWDGSAWASVGGGMAGSGGTVSVLALERYDAGGGQQLYAFGNFATSGGLATNGFARWNGSAWSALGAGVTPTTLNKCLGLYDDGSPGGSKLVLGGQFTRAGTYAVQGLATWDGMYSTLGPGVGTTGAVSAIAIHDSGSGPALFMAGNFDAAGGAPDVQDVGRWDGTNLTSMGSGTDGPIYALASHDDGSGRMLYAGGQFHAMDGSPAFYAARWNGSGWSQVGGGLPGRVVEFVEADDGAGTQLFAIGNFAPSVRRWDGVTWSSVPWDPLFQVETAVMFDDGSGPRLHAAGTQHHPDTTFERCVARLDGNAWTKLGGAFEFVPGALCVYDDGGGPRLHAFGEFNTVGGVAIEGAAKWDGATWVQLGAGLGPAGPVTAEVFSTAVWDDQTDSRALLYVVGAFTQAGGSPVSNIAAWDGLAWHDVGGGANNRIEAIQIYQQAGGPDLYVGGTFTQVGTRVAYRLARYANTCSELVGATACFGDGSGTACPCGNTSSTGDRRGCLNSLGLGAGLRAVGRASVSLDSFQLQASGMPNSSILYFQGTAVVNGGNGAAFGDGLRCVAGSVRRLGTKLNTAGASVYPDAGDTRIAAAGGMTDFAGVTRYYQAWYRNAAGFCSPSTFNLTNALEVFWSP
ncbi:MAG: hypothetical protein JNK02_14410 [Planctomycetes bacterium]|nr:hypothetical protein [Planctomycetota bacterium]